MSFALQLDDGRRVLLTESPLTIGRDARSTIAFPEDERVGVSHARIRRVGERWLLEAEGQSFVRVGLAAPARLHWLEVGDEILLGSTGPRLVVTSDQDTVPAETGSSQNVVHGTPQESRDQWPRRPTINALVGVIAVIGIGLVARAVVPGGARLEDHEQGQSHATNENDSVATPRRASSPSESAATRPEDQSGIVSNDADWNRADFLLVNPEHLAVAMRQDDSGFRVEAKASDDEAQQRIATAWETGVPLIGADKSLTQRIFKFFGTGQTVKTEAELGQELTEWWRKRAYVPPEATLVAFNDLRHRRRRVGFRWQGTTGHTEFLELNRPFAPPNDSVRPRFGPSDTPIEPLNEALIQPGSMIGPLSDDELRSKADFLDYCIYHVRRRLSSTHPSYVAVIVKPVACAPGAGNRLASETQRLHAEIHEKLSEAGIVILERQLLSEIKAENKRGFERPGPAAAQKAQLVGGSHLIAAEIRPPVRRGDYELSFRMISLTTGKITWAGQGDRLDTSERAIELASSPFLLNTGKVKTFAYESQIASARLVSKEVSLGGLPLHSPPLVFPPPTSAPVLDPKAKPRGTANPSQIVPDELGYIEEGNEADSVLFRGLFEQHSQRIAKSAMGTTRDVLSLADVPVAHQMRYVIWRLATSVVPTAGRVLAADGSTIRMSLKRSDRLQPGDRIRVLRLSQDSGSTGSPAERVIPIETIVSEVHDGSSVAIAESNSGGTSSILPGDIVHRQPRQAATVAVIPVKPSRLDPNALVVSRSLGLGQRNQDIPSAEDAEELAVTRLASLVEGGLKQAKVTTVERANLTKALSGEKNAVGAEWKLDPSRTAELGRLSGATHVLLATLAPTRDIRGQYDVASNLRIVDVETGLVVENLDFTFRYYQMEYWKP